MLKDDCRAWMGRHLQLYGGGRPPPPGRCSRSHWKLGIFFHSNATKKPENIPRPSFPPHHLWHCKYCRIFERLLFSSVYFWQLHFYCIEVCITTRRVCNNNLNYNCSSSLCASMFLHTCIFYIQIYLISAITLFALPNISVHFTGFFRHITMPFILPVAHIGMVNKYRVSQKKQELVFRGHLMPLIGQK